MKRKGEGIKIEKETKKMKSNYKIERTTQQKFAFWGKKKK